MTGTVTETAFQNAVVELAHVLDWRAAHFRPGRTRQGWRTPGQYDAAGWPDLVLVRDRILFVECKSDTGRMTQHQTDWAQAITKAGGTFYQWAPHDWDEIEVTLR